MESTARNTARAGWHDSETEYLVCLAREAARDGKPLRGAFEKAAQSLGRRPNSVRNHYYAHLRTQESTARRASFRAFTEDEVDALLTFVARGRREGRSVRSCVMQLAGGDRTLMLRYQNKYRSLLKSAPERVEAAAAQCETAAPAAAPRAIATPPDDPVTIEFMNALHKLLTRGQGAAADQTRADRDRVRIDLMRLKLTEQGEAAAALLDCVEAYMNQSDTDRARTLPALCERLPPLCGALRAALSIPHGI